MKLHYKEIGEGHPTLILHGLFGMLDNWMTAGKMLADHFSIYLLDLRNHGQSPHSDDFSYHLLAEDLVEFIQTHDLGEVDVIGHSMGGKAAMQLALDYPDLVRRLIVVDIAPREYPPYHREIFEALQAVEPEQAGRRIEIEEALMEKLQDAEVVAFLTKNLARLPDGGYAWRMNLPVLSEKYPEIGAAVDADVPFRKPSLFIRGERSNYITDSDHGDILHLFPDARFETIAGAGHWVHAEKPEEIVEVIRGFLS